MQDWATGVIAARMIEAVERAVPARLLWAVEFQDGVAASSPTYLTRMRSYSESVYQMIAETQSVEPRLLERVTAASTVGWIRCIVAPGEPPVDRAAMFAQCVAALEAAGLGGAGDRSPGVLWVAQSPVVFSDGTGQCVFTRTGVNKARGLAAVAELAGFELGELAAFGDGENDVAMLAAAGYSACPSNSTAQAKRVVHRISALSNDAGFVAKEVGAISSARINARPKLKRPGGGPKL